VLRHRCLYLFHNAVLVAGDLFADGGVDLGFGKNGAGHVQVLTTVKRLIMQWPLLLPA
jgi:hypothetical protein